MKARDGKAADNRRRGARRAACVKRESRSRDEARRGAAGLIRRLSCHVRLDTHADRETDACAIKNISSDYPVEDGETFQRVVLTDCKEIIWHSIPMIQYRCPRHMRHVALQSDTELMWGSAGVMGRKSSGPHPGDRPRRLLRQCRTQAIGRRREAGAEVAAQ